MNLRTLTVTEAAAQTGLKAETIRRLLKSGTLTGPKVGRNFRVSVASLEAWVHRTPETSAPTSATRAFPEVESRFSS